MSGTYNRADMPPRGYGDRLRALREERGWSQTVLAEKARVSRDTVVRAEQSENVRIFSLYDLVAALNVPIGALFQAPPASKQEFEFVRLFRSAGDGARRHVLSVLYRLTHEEPPTTER